MEVAVMRRNKPLQVSAISTLLLIFQLLVVSTDPLPLIEIFILKQISFCFYHLMFTVDYTTVKKEFFPCTAYYISTQLLRKMSLNQVLNRWGFKKKVQIIKQNNLKVLGWSMWSGSTRQVNKKQINSILLRNIFINVQLLIFWKQKYFWGGRSILMLLITWFECKFYCLFEVWIFIFR